MAQSGVWSQGDSSRIVVPAVFPGEEEEGVGRKGSGGIYFPSPLREAVEDGNPCPARVGDKKKPGMVKTWLFSGVGWRSRENAG